MPIVPLEIQPGFYANATPYKGRARWATGNLVRFHNDGVEPIGGWIRRADVTLEPIDALVADPTIEVVRDIISWNDTSLGRNVVFGTNAGLYHINSLGDVQDLTPSGVNVSGKNASTVAGYGQNPYGVGAYGVENNVSGQPPIPPNRWVWDNFGSILLAAQRGTGPIYSFNPITDDVDDISDDFGAPTDVQDIVVTDQRIVMTVGGGNNPRGLVWSDQENFADWTPRIDNQAGDFVLPGTGRLLRAINVLNQVLILGQTDAFIGRYLGPPLVYAFDLVGRNCGPLTPYSVGATERFAVWLGNKNFWMFDGSLKLLQCDVMDFLMRDLESSQVSKITSFTIQDFTEVWWLYQSTQSSEVDSYVTWNYATNIWTTGRLARTAGNDKGTLQSVIMVDHDGVIFNHELENVLPVGDIFIQSGEIDIANGERNVAVRALYPDSLTFGDIETTIIGKQFPTGVEFSYGPYTYNNPIDTRAIGRSVKMRFRLLNSTSVLGTFRADIAPYGGKR